MKMARVVVLTALVALSPVAPALAGTLLQSANRLASQAGQQMQPTSRAALGRSADATQSTAAESGMSKRKKVLIVVVGAIGVAAGMYAIDRGVVDNTPSSRGTRRD